MAELDQAPPNDRVSAEALRTLALLVGVVALAFLDRQMVNLVVDPVRTDVGVSDAQYSLLQGGAFMLVYTLGMLPIAWASDRFNRKHIIIASVLVWSAMTAAFGLAQGFAALLVTRAGVALGEAGISPAGTSAVRDLWPQRFQMRALTALTLGVYVGGALSFAGGGPALQWLAAHEPDLPGRLAPWRYLFIAAGALGLVATGLLVFMREPSRGQAPRAEASWAEYFHLFIADRTRAGAFLTAYVGAAVLFAALGAWLPTLFMREHGWSPKTVGLFFGAASLVGGAAGALGAGWLADRVSARQRSRALFWVVRAGVLMMGGGALLAILAPDMTTAFLATSLAQIGVGACVGLGAMGFQSLFPARFSGRSVALYLLVANGLGGSLGPTAAPLLGRALGSGSHLGPPLAVCTVMATVWSLAWLSLPWAVSRWRALAPTQSLAGE